MCERAAERRLTGRFLRCLRGKRLRASHVTRCGVCRSGRRFHRLMYRRYRQRLAVIHGKRSGFSLRGLLDGLGRLKDGRSRNLRWFVDTFRGLGSDACGKQRSGCRRWLARWRYAPDNRVTMQTMIELSL